MDAIIFYFSLYLLLMSSITLIGIKRMLIRLFINCATMIGWIFNLFGRWSSAPVLFTFPECSVTLW